MFISHLGFLRKFLGNVLTHFTDFQLLELVCGQTIKTIVMTTKNYYQSFKYENKSTEDLRGGKWDMGNR